MSRAAWSVLVGLALLVGGVAVVRSKQQSLAHLAVAPVLHPSVQVVSVTSGRLEVTAHYLGSIEPVTRSDLAARVSGNILTIAKREGDFIAQGETLITIDDREWVDRTAALHAEELAVRAKLAGAQSALASQQAAYERDVALREVGAISQEALERSRATLDGVTAARDAYQASLQGLAMTTEVARTQAGYAHLTAPFAGVVSRRWAEPGDMTVPGKPILTIERTTGYKVLIQVPQESLAGIRPGTLVRLTNGGQSLPAKINRIYPALGRNLLATAAVLVERAPFDLPSLATVGVEVVTDAVEGLIVPDQALVRTTQGVFVYGVEDGLVRIRSVMLLGLGNGRAAVSGPLSPGQQVVVAQESRLLALSEGDSVTPVEADPPAAASPSAISTAPAGGER